MLPVELRTFLIRDAAGRPTSMWSIIRDLTDRKATEEVTRLWSQTLEQRLGVSIHVRDHTVFLESRSRVHLLTAEAELKELLAGGSPDEPFFNGPDNEQGFVPFHVMRDLKDLKDPDEIVFQPASASMNKTALAAVREVVARRHHFDPKDEKATPNWDTVEGAEMMNAFSFGLQAVLGLIGMVTLGVGGVGVMNIMLVSVTERTREIGLRKALGARKGHILIQFLLEALVLTFMGGIVGMAVAVLLTWIIPPMPLYGELHKTLNHEGDIFLRASTSVMMISFTILALVGIVSGFFPALKASRMDPVEALRYE